MPLQGSLEPSGNCFLPDTPHADFLFLITSSATDQILYILFGCITAILLEKHTSDYDQLKEQYIHTVDDQTEKKHAPIPET